jgi:Sel1 repeat
MSFQIEIDKAIKEQRLYFLGDSLPTDWYAAFRTWMPMAEAGEPKAQYNVGRCFDRGDGIDKDPEKANYWYLKAAAQNDPRAFNNLYIHHSDKTSPHFDLELAERYLQKAVELNEPRALNVLKGRADAKEAKAQADAAAEEQRLFEQERDQFISANIAAREKITEFLEVNDIAGARKFIQESNDARIEWIKELIDFFYIEHVSHQIISRDEVKLYDVGQYNGTTQYMQNTNTTFSAVVKLLNKSPKTIRIKVLNSGNMGYTNTVITFSPGELKSIEIYSKPDGFYPEFEAPIFKHVIRGQNFSINKAALFIKFGKVITIPRSTSSTSKGGCFVLTACYGNENHPVVKDFRGFRDQVLLVTPMGKALVGTYYKHGPAAADYVRNKPRLKMMLRGLFFAIRFFLPKQK